jgi:hypothetical protein
MNIILIGEREKIKIIGEKLWKNIPYYSLLETMNYEDADFKGYIRKIYSIIIYTTERFEKHSIDSFNTFCETYNVLPIFISDEPNDTIEKLYKVYENSIRPNILCRLPGKADDSLDCSELLKTINNVRL